MFFNLAIVPVHEIGEFEGRHYFTMDYIDGRSLSDEIRESSLAPKRAAELVRQVALAVHFAHQQGTLHRDLKPANVLLTNDDVPMVTDFGLANFLDAVDDDTRAELTTSGQILGTPTRTIKWIRRRPSLAATLAIALLATTMLLAVWVLMTVRISKHRDFAVEQFQRQAVQVMRKASGVLHSKRSLRVPDGSRCYCLYRCAY